MKCGRTMRVGFAMAVTALSLRHAAAQASAAVPAPAVPAGQPQFVPGVTQPVALPNARYTDSTIAKRPYDAIFTRPQYPTTPPEQKQFTVEYVYNYAESLYRPPVALPTVAKAVARFNTPENAVIALYSAMRRNDFDAYLDCFDTPSRASLEAQDKASPRFRAELEAQWKQYLVGHSSSLESRLDTVNYIILKISTDNALGTGKPLLDNEILTFDRGRWTISNQFTGDMLITAQDLHLTQNALTFQPGLAPLKNPADPVELNDKAQEVFLKAKTGQNKQTVTVQ